MNVLVVGFSSLVQRRVLPALATVPEVERISLASRRPLSEDVLPSSKRGRVYRGYAEGLAQCEPGLAYISLPNSMHAEWAGRALEAGFHVVVDKPSVTAVADAAALVDLAESKTLCLSEANVWHYHPLTRMVKSIVDETGRAPLSICATFSSPPLDPKNFRYRPDLGGGILLDRGSYAISCGRFFFGGLPEETVCRVVSCDRKGSMDISFHVMMVYAGGSVMQGFFSLEAEYRNALSIIGSSYSLAVDRIFTPPADYGGAVCVRRHNETASIPVPTGDTFALYLQDVLQSIQQGSVRHFSRRLLEDARRLHDLIASAKGG